MNTAGILKYLYWEEHEKGDANFAAIHTARCSSWYVEYVSPQARFRKLTIQTHEADAEDRADDGPVPRAPSLTAARSSDTLTRRCGETAYPFALV